MKSTELGHRQEDQKQGTCLCKMMHEMFVQMLYFYFQGTLRVLFAIFEYLKHCNFIWKLSHQIYLKQRSTTFLIKLQREKENKHPMDP